MWSFTVYPDGINVAGQKQYYKRMNQTQRISYLYFRLLLPNNRRALRIEISRRYLRSYWMYCS